MQSKAQSVASYIQALPEERKEGMSRLRQTLLDIWPQGFAEEVSNG